MIEVSSVQTEVTPLDVEVTASNSTEIATVEDGLDVTITKKEYKIVGDEVYIAKLYDDAPQWMKDLVQLVVDNTVEQTNIELLNSVVEQLNQFATSYVPLNMYTQQVLDLSNADASMHALIETINSNFNNGLDEANAQIIGLENTKASKDEVIAQVLTTISSELATPTSDLGATIANLQQSIVTGDTANANSIQALTSSLEGEVDARATAISALDTRVTATETAVTAQASNITALTTEVNNGTHTWAAADSQVTNSLTTKIENDVASVESKWEYNSVVGINGVYKRSGFGLTTNYSGGSGTEADPYTSEFWIDATKLKFTNSAATGRTAPFTIDASGATPQITFNGKVSFSNVTGTPTHTSGLLANRPASPVAGSTYTATDQDNQIYTYTNVGWIAGGDPDALTAADLGPSGTTVIDGGRITTGSIAADKIAANSITAGQIAAGSVTADRLSSTNGIGSVWTGGGLVSQNFNGNVNGAIGAPTQGFRLSSNATGTSDDPNIYGGYIKGGAIEGAQLIGTVLSVNDIKVAAVGYPNNYGPITLIEAYSGGTVNTSSIFYSRGYPIGYNNKRMCSESQIFILQALTVGGFSIYSTVTTYVSIRVSINGGPWTVIASGSGVLGIASCAITYAVDSTNNVQFSSTHSSNSVQSSNFSIQSTNGQ